MVKGQCEQASKCLTTLPTFAVAVGHNYSSAIYVCVLCSEINREMSYSRPP